MKTQGLGRETYHFIVVCPHASAVYLVGAFNGWSTSATPMQNTERDVWQISLEMAGGEGDFSYFVIDDRWRTGRAPFGNTFMLPGTWAQVVRTGAAPAVLPPLKGRAEAATPPSSPAARHAGESLN